jgi:glutamine cyclotransferase
VLRSFPHDPTAFTQGLVYTAGYLYEGTGLLGQSSVRKRVLETGNLLLSRDLPPPHFGEGITVMNGRLYQLTWQTHTGFVYDLASFKLRQEFTYETEGWGLTHDGKRLIMSDGTLTLYYLDPKTLQVVDQREVQNVPPFLENARLNELEYIKGRIYANVWPTTYIVIIDAGTGYVSGWADLAGLRDSLADDASIDVLNGIAYDAGNKRLLVTGKRWPWLYQIELAPVVTAK